ncbi:MAG: hypothetical protein NWE94_00880 [Candidatus Bathyarchaeota archaeon]|nr:hypothetical protein [Candidatus Bathyarchaeota archaeon]
MKKTAVLLVLSLLVMTLGIHTSDVAVANPIPAEPIAVPPSISIQSPANETYNTNNVNLKFSVSGNWNPCSEPHYSLIQFSLDDANPTVVYSPGYYSGMPVQLNMDFSIILKALSEGSHRVVITAVVAGLYLRGQNKALDIGHAIAHASVDFCVDTSHQSEISILSPINRTYNTTEISITFTMNRTSSLTGIGYSLDGQANVTIVGNTTVAQLAEGAHTITVYGWYSDINTVTAGTHFAVDITAPKILVHSPKNKVYNTSDIQLIFTVDESVSQIYYSMDDQERIIINENATLTGLPNGSHKLTIYAEDEAGNIGESEIVAFITEAPFPSTLVVAVAVLLVILCLVLLIMHFGKRNRNG